MSGPNRGVAAGGFSVIELMIVLVVAGILAALAGPAFVDSVRDQRLSTANSRVVGALMLARSEAVKRNQPVSLCVPLNQKVARKNLRCLAAPTGWEGGIIVFVNKYNVGSSGWQIKADTDGNCADDEDEDCVISLLQPLDDNVTVRGANPGGTAITRTITYLPDGTVSVGGKPFFTACDQRGAAYARSVHVTSTGRPKVRPKAPDGSDLTCP